MGTSVKVQHKDITNFQFTKVEIVGCGKMNISKFAKLYTRTSRQSILDLDSFKLTFNPIISSWMTSNKSILCGLIALVTGIQLKIGVE